MECLGFFSHHDNKKNSGGGDIDYERLRHDLIEEFFAEGVAYSGDLGFLDALEVKEASHEELLRIARREGVNVDRYRR